MRLARVALLVLFLSLPGCALDGGAGAVADRDLIDRVERVEKEAAASDSPTVKALAAQIAEVMAELKKAREDEDAAKRKAAETVTNPMNWTPTGVLGGALAAAAWWAKRRRGDDLEKRLRDLLASAERAAREEVARYDRADDDTVYLPSGEIVKSAALVGPAKPL